MRPATHLVDSSYVVHFCHMPFSPGNITHTHIHAAVAS